MNIKFVEKISNIARDTKFLFLIIFVIISTLLLQHVYKKRENILLHELRSTENKKDELDLRLNNALKSIEPLKSEINNLRKMVLLEKTLANLKVADKEDQLLWPNAATSADAPKTGSPVHPAEKTEPRPLSPPQNRLDLPAATVTGTEKSLLRLKEYLKEMEGENLILKKRSEELGNLLNLREQEISKLNRDNLALKEDLDKALKSQKELKEEFASQTGRLKERLSLKENEASQLNNIKAGFEARLMDLNIRTTDLIKTNANLEKQLLEKDKDNASLQNELGKIKEELSGQKNEAESLRKKIGIAAGELEQKEREKTELLKELAGLKEWKKSTEAELDQLRAKGASREIQISQLNERINELNSTRNTVNEDIAQLKGLLKKKDADIQNSQNEIAFLKKDLEKAFRERDKLLSAMQEKEETIAGLRHDLVSARSSQVENAGQLNEFQSLNAALKRELLNIAQELELLRLEYKAAGRR